MIQEPVTKMRFEGTAINAFRTAVVTEEFMERLRGLIKSAGIRLPTMYYVGNVPPSQKFVRHLMVRAVVEEDHEAGKQTVRRLRIAPDLTILEQTDVTNSQSRPTRRGKGHYGRGDQNPRVSMGDYED